MRHTSSQDSSMSRTRFRSLVLPLIKLKPVAAISESLPRTPSNNSNSNGTTSLDRTTKCATVTMMLAERIIRNDWSVEDEHFFEPNNMNVWQTLEILSGLNSRKRYNYEGYNDNSKALRTLTPSWHRDSFVEKNVNPNGDESQSGPNGKYTAVVPNNPSGFNNNSANLVDGGVSGNGLQVGSDLRNGGGKKKGVSQRRLIQRKRAIELDPEYALSPSDYTDLIKCTFNLPRISAALERLMGTNVVRLTDRNYMKELRERIEDDFRANLQKRIRARELKEVERERVLIIEGKTNIIPAELADDPIFMVDKKANVEIAKSRAKLKTSREKNADRLKLQAVKWERDRLQHESEETERLNVLRQRFKEQKDLEEQYKNEDADRGMALLRIENEDWRPCEKQLKEFLESERAKMKERSLRAPTQFATDPKDMNNILKARKAFREVERRIRKAIEDTHKDHVKAKRLPHQQSGQLQSASQSTINHQAVLKESASDLFFASDFETSLGRKNTSADDDSNISSGESLDADSSISLAKQRYAEALQLEYEKDVQEGRVISKEQYEQLRYEDDKIMQLRNAKDIRELYQLAEEIIIGERVESYADEEEALAEEEQNLEPEVKEEYQ